MAGAKFRNRGTGAGAKASPDPLPPLLQSLVTALPGPVLALDRGDRVAAASAGAEAMLGLSTAALERRSLRDLFPEGIDHDPSRTTSACGRPLEVSITRRRMDHDGVSLTLLWLQDVTGRRSEAILKRDLRDLERAARAKSEFVASLSHEIRTPMNAVLGMTDILLDSDLDEEQRELAQRVRRAGTGLLAMLNDILDLSRVEAGHLEFEARSFPVRPWLDEALDLFRAQAEVRGLRLEGRVDPAVPALVRGDAPRLRQVLVNLVGNALKFTAEGRITVTIGVCTRTLDLLFSVRDTGIGIEPPLLEHLFEPWARASSAAGESGGTGLGLAIARRYVQHMGGTIEATSRPGRGSVFRFRVPQQARASSAPEPLPIAPAHHDGART